MRKLICAFCNFEGKIKVINMDDDEEICYCPCCGEKLDLDHQPLDFE